MKNTGKFIAYFRVSIERRERAHLELEDQMKAVTDYLNGGDWELIEEFTEIEIQRKTDRPKFEAALAECHEQEAKLVIAKLGRLSRIVLFLQQLHQHLMCEL